MDNFDRLLVKAKRVDNGEWMTGHYLYRYCYDFKLQKSICVHQIYVDSGDITAICLFDIDPDTICQCTGLKDSYNKLMFEGDIIRVDDDGEEVETYIKHGYEYDYPAFDTDYQFTVESNNLSMLKAVCADIEVIGNVHDGDTDER